MIISLPLDGKHELSTLKYRYALTLVEVVFVWLCLTINLLKFMQTYVHDITHGGEGFYSRAVQNRALYA